MSGADGPPALSLEGVTRRFGPVTALAGVTLEVPAGAGLLLLGENGAGKSTLLRVAAGIARPTRGRALVFGESPARPAGRSRLGYLGHRGFLHDHLTARENLLLQGGLHGLPRDEAARRADRLLERIGLARAAHRPVRGFSRGMVQRLALARTLLHGPDLLLLDEPFTGLDPRGRALLVEWLAEERAAGRALVVVTHRPEPVLPLVDRVAILRRGRVALAGPAGARSPAAWADAIGAPAEATA